MSYHNNVKIPKWFDQLFDLMEINSRVMMRTRFKPYIPETYNRSERCTKQTIAYARM